MSKKDDNTKKDPKEIDRGKNGGAPKIPIDWEKAAKYAEAGCNGKQIASTLGISYSTLRKRFKDEMVEVTGFKHFSAYIKYHSRSGVADLMLSTHVDAVSGKDKFARTFALKYRAGWTEDRKEDKKTPAVKIEVISSRDTKGGKNDYKDWTGS